MSPQDAARQPACVHGRPRRGGRRDERVRHGRRQGRRAHGRALGAADEPRGLLPGGRPRRARRRAGARAAAGLAHGPRPADPVHQRARDERRGRPPLRGPPASRRRATRRSRSGTASSASATACCCRSPSARARSSCGPAAATGCSCGSTGAGSPRAGAPGDQGGPRPRLGVLPLDRALQRGRPDLPRRQILDHFGDAEQGRAHRPLLRRVRPRSGDQQAVPKLRSRPRRRGRSRAPRGGLHPRTRTLDPVSGTQFETLRAWRMDRAQGKPAYTVAPDATLEEVLRRRPSSTAELIEIRGIGPAFCEKHGSRCWRRSARCSGSSAVDARATHR